MVRRGRGRFAGIALATATVSAPQLMQAAPTPGSASNGPVVMAWIDLRGESAGVQAFRRLWDDKLHAAQRQWLDQSQESRPLPAYTLAHAFNAAQPPVLVSILFTMNDCELPGNGAGADLYARCPMRVVSGIAGARKVTTVDRVCHLYVPPVTRPRDGPDPQKNHTTVALDAGRTLRLRVVQFGRPVPACNLDLELE